MNLLRSPPQDLSPFYLSFPPFLLTQKKTRLSSFVKESLTLIPTQLTPPKPCPINNYSSFLNLLISSGSLFFVTEFAQISPSPNKQFFLQSCCLQWVLLLSSQNGKLFKKQSVSTFSAPIQSLQFNFYPHYST